MTSAVNSHGVDLRGSSVTDLTTVLIGERSRVHDLQAKENALNAEVNRLAKSVSDRRVSALQPQLDALRGAVGMTPVSGAGLTVTLEDAPKEVIDRARQTGSVPIDALVVHQQDIQSVVNALWAGGAQAMTVQGQRIISTTGIKCVGNTVVLHGVPYSPPYVISAVGDVNALQHSLDTSEFVAAYQTFVSTYQLGWSVTSSEMTLPAFVGTADLSVAKVASPAQADKR